MCYEKIGLFLNKIWLYTIDCILYPYSRYEDENEDESEIYIDVRTRDLTGDAFLTEPLDIAYTKKKVGVELEAYRVMQRQNK